MNLEQPQQNCEGFAIEGLVANVAPGALSRIESMDERFFLLTARQRFQTLTLSGFGGLAMLLSALGVYTVLAHSVARRTRELGVRRALGATRSHVFAYLLRRALASAATGILIGLAISYGLRRVLTSYLFEIQPTDAPTYVIVTLGLAAVILIASGIPAYRGARLDPIAALRYE